MAKKNNAEKAKQPKTEQKPKAPKFGLMPLLAPVMAGTSVLTLALTATLVFLVIGSGANQQWQLFAESSAEHHVDDLVELSLNYQAVLSTMANSQWIKQDLDSDDETLARREQQLTSMLPGATLVKIFRAGKARKDSTTTPPISFAQLDMVAKAEDETTETAPEIQFADKKKYLTLAVPIPGNPKPVGTLLASFAFSEISRQLTPLKPELGYVELIQTFAGKSQVILTNGNSQHKSGSGFSAQSRFSHWSAVFYPAPTTNIVGGYTQLVWIIGGVFAVLCLALSFVSFWLVKNALLRNASVLADHIYCHVNNEQSKQAFTLGLFSSLAVTLQNHLRDVQARAQAAAALTAKQKSKELGETKQAKPSTPESEKTMAFKDDALDIELDEADSNLLSGAAAFEDDYPLDLEDMGVADPEFVNINVKVAPEIFRAYDIRGIVGETLDADVAHAIGMAIASEALTRKQDTVVIARDGRHSSRDLAESLAHGLRESGCNVIDIGVVPTPVLYYATKTLATQSGVMVTGSHNPPQYNGFKIVIADETLANEQIQGLYQRIEQGKLHQGQGTYEVADISSEYQDRICNDVVLARPMRVVLDTGNGVAGPLAAAILDSLGCMVTPINTEIDGSFPNHHPDPSNPANLQQLIDMVQTEHADIGLALDGDGDRLGVVTTSGKIIWPDKLLMLFAKDLLSRSPGADILYDVKCTRDVAELVSSFGGRAIMCPTGHSLMKAKMRETGAVVGGELSGHLFFNDRWYGFDDAIYSAARLLEILSMEPEEADEIFAEFPERHTTPELHINLPDKLKFNFIEKLKSQGNFEGGNLVKVDGVRVDFPQSWGLIRASNTMPVLVARFEGDTEEALEQVKTLFREQLLAIDPGLSIPF